MSSVILLTTSCGIFLVVLMVQVWRVGCVFDGCSDFGPFSTYEINVNIVRDEKQKTVETKEGAKKKKKVKEKGKKEIMV